MLDKAGIATLLRLMFIAQQRSIRHYLFEIFQDVCENRLNRLEVISTLLRSSRMEAPIWMPWNAALASSPLKLSSRRRRSPRPPTDLKRTFTNISTNNQITRTQRSRRCWSSAMPRSSCRALIQNVHIPPLFLTEHETVASTLKRSFSRKGKGKDVANVNTKAQKYAINSLLSLLEPNSGDGELRP